MFECLCSTFDWLKLDKKKSWRECIEERFDDIHEQKWERKFKFHNTRIEANSFLRLSTKFVLIVDIPVRIIEFRTFDSCTKGRYN